MSALTVTETLTPAVFSETGGIEALFQKIETEARAVATDISTPAGRAAVKSLAYKVVRSKTALDEMGKNLVADLKKQTGAVDAERRVVRERLDALADEVRKPLTDWENADKDRIAAHQAALQAVIDLAIFEEQRPPSAAVISRLRSLDELPQRDWQEFAVRAKDARGSTFATLTALKESALAYEAEQAELARLRAEAAEREQREREERIAREAAERATREALQKAEREARAAAEREAAERMRIEREATEANERAERAERDRIAAVEKAERDRRAAEEKAARDQAAAVEAERKRVADAKAAEEAAEARREANRRHRTRVLLKAGSALTAAGLTDDAAKLALAAIARGDIPHVTISF